ncbi:hypothetical protein [Latilactobacillus sakei]|uniref:hypothetical protein n=1 Tax=Latilactobacillus sakei TaxID=1599 RepID=UPI000DC64970|nr:hypothetical protein [Latilactobacillus sakei]SPS03906.1 hypothetical protein LAS9624_00732 [Latilactobacillus sakei]
MKKLIISFILLLSLICLAPTATYARAGGASGGGGGSTSSGSFGGSTSTTTDRTTNNYYGRRGYYGPRNFLNNLVFAIFFIVSAFLMIIRKKRDWLARRHELSRLTMQPANVLKNAFTKLKPLGPPMILVWSHRS